ncbi:MAG: cytidine deaminase [Bacillota bacterium]
MGDLGGERAAGCGAGPAGSCGPCSDETLVELAKGARELAYAPYSGFAVGAALLTRSGDVFTGCNVENASYGLTVCAERVAIFKAVSQGHREFVALAVVADTEGVCLPCGACRQVMREFGDLRVIMANLRGERAVSSVGELLPWGFSLPRGGRDAGNPAPNTGGAR